MNNYQLYYELYDGFVIVTEAKYLYMWMKCMHARGARLVMALLWSSSSRRAHRCLRSLSGSKVGGGVGFTSIEPPPNLSENDSLGPNKNNKLV